LVKNILFFNSFVDLLYFSDYINGDKNIGKKFDIPTMCQLMAAIDVSEYLANYSDFVEIVKNDRCIPKPLPCDHTNKFRTLSGWCNNVKSPHYGNAFTPIRRLVLPAYDDGI
jgi:hypothetical protein